MQADSPTKTREESSREKGRTGAGLTQAWSIYTHGAKSRTRNGGEAQGGLSCGTASRRCGEAKARPKTRGHGSVAADWARHGRLLCPLVGSSVLQGARRRAQRLGRPIERSWPPELRDRTLTWDPDPADDLGAPRAEREACCPGAEAPDVGRATKFQGSHGALRPAHPRVVFFLGAFDQRQLLCR